MGNKPPRIYIPPVRSWFSRPNPSPPPPPPLTPEQILINSLRGQVSTQSTTISNLSGVVTVERKKNTAANKRINELDSAKTQLQKTELSEIGYSILTAKKENELIDAKIKDQTFKNDTDNKKSYYNSIEIDNLKAFNFISIILYYIIFFILILFLFLGSDQVNVYLKVFLFLFFLVYPFTIKPIEYFLYYVIAYMCLFNLTDLAFTIFILFIILYTLYLSFDYFKMAFIFIVDKFYSLFLFIWNFIMRRMYGNTEQKIQNTTS